MINIKTTLLINITCGISTGIVLFLLWGNLWWIGFGLGSGITVAAYSILKRIKDIKVFERNKNYCK